MFLIRELHKADKLKIDLCLKCQSTGMSLKLCWPI